MYAVIFRASIKQLDETYTETAAELRELAKTKYGCIDFVSVCEGDQELAISYWPSMEKIHAWKLDPVHVRAQELGKTRWYRSYQVHVVEILREYRAEQQE